jgi:hypothetical protein
MTHTSVTTQEIFNTEGDVVEINGDTYKIAMGSVSVPIELNDVLPVTYTNTLKFCFADVKYVSRTYYDCGSNPFTKEKRRVDFYNKDIASLLFTAAYGRKSDDFNAPEYREPLKNGGTTGGVNFNPYVIDANGEKQYYQRDLVWTLEQKQLLIDSIYNGIEIGKFLFRYNDWNKIVAQVEEGGHGYNFDCVDGKQRFFTILHFVQNKFPDSHGNYWSDLSNIAQRRFLSFGNLSYGQLSDHATDDDVINNFLTLNFTGTPMSKEHIDYVRSFNMK